MLQDAPGPGLIQVPSPFMRIRTRFAMSEERPAPSGAPATEPAPQADAPRPAWYATPWFWAALVLIALLGLLAWHMWRQWQEAELEKQAAQATLRVLEEQERLLVQQREQWLALLREDPCLVKERLSSLPAAAPTDIPATPPPAASHETTPAPQAAPAVTPVPAVSQARQIEDATVLILARQSGGLALGSGFFISSSHVLTNAHVIGDARDVFLINGKTGGIRRAQPLRLAVDKGRDFALLSLDKPASVQALRFAPDPQRTERVSAWGFPGAVSGDDPKFRALLAGKSQTAPEVVYSDGVVNVVLDRTPRLIVHSATVSQGNSGGPLVNAAGHVVGINTFIKLDEESYRQSSLAIVASSVMDFLREAGVPFAIADDTAKGTR